MVVCVTAEGIVNVKTVLANVYVKTLEIRKVSPSVTKLVGTIPGPVLVLEKGLAKEVGNLPFQLVTRLEPDVLAIPVKRDLRIEEKLHRHLTANRLQVSL